SSTGSRLSATLCTQLRIHVPHRRQIRRPRPGVELADERVVALFGFELRDAAARIVEVAEHDRVSRARLLTRRLDLAVGYPAVPLLRFDLCGVDALHAVGAFLHHAAAANRDVGIPTELQARRVPVLIEKEVEASDFVRAVVGAVARTDTAVVHHVVQPLVAVSGRADRTYD